MKRFSRERHYTRMGNETTNLTTLVGNAIANDTVFNWNKQWTGGFRLAAETRKVRMLKVTVVLLADDDGTHATGEVTPGGKVVPVTPWLRNPAIHTKSGESYIDDLISLTNKQLFASGANFLLDRVNANYIFEKSTVVNNLTFTAGGNDAVAFIEKKRKEIGGEAWRDSVLLLFPWGKFGDATRSLPEGQGFSGSNWPFVKLAVWGYNRDRFVDGELVAG
ncbi:MAG TPA: hypothetical protein VMU84_05060, partial [Thermoanaerobaculia bacterium]|nr:hypothetical protein [Thermoanaerobaculia bacterium]